MIEWIARFSKAVPHNIPLLGFIVLFVAIGAYFAVRSVEEGLFRREDSSEKEKE